MAKSRQSLVHGKIDDLTKCSICTEIFTSPKILPCVHTFCLHCLETYGKDKQPGDQLTCPICRNEFAIPNGGLRKLPNNFFIGEMVEIRKLAMAPMNEALCNICPDGEEAVAQMYCVDCEQIICERCSKSHKKIKFSQTHQIVELGSKSDVHSMRNSYCEHHPKELINMYCHDDNVAICLICCVESHQFHKCVNVEEAAETFTKRLKEDLRKLTFRSTDREEVEKNLDKCKNKFLKEISETEESIRDNGTKMKELIDQHTDKLVHDLQLVKEQNLKALEMTLMDVEGFRVMIDIYSRYSEELLSRGSPVDICRTAHQLHTRASELEKLPSNCSGDPFHCDTVVFRPSSFKHFLEQNQADNAIGELKVTKSPDRRIKFQIQRAGKSASRGRRGVVTRIKHGRAAWEKDLEIVDTRWPGSPSLSSESSEELIWKSKKNQKKEQHHLNPCAEQATSEIPCGTCPEEEKVKAKMFCFECEQNLCERCGVIHNKMKLSQHHQVDELGCKPQEITFRNSYCDQHPVEQVKMYCEEDKATICILCFAESHQTHKCLSITKASEEVSSALKNDLEAIKRRLPECKDSLDNLKKLKIDLLTEIAKWEKKIASCFC